MSEKKFHEMPTECPVSGGELYVSELTCEESGVVIRGKFSLPQGSELSEEERKFLNVFLRARGVISTVEKEMGMSYPTVRSKLDALLDSMNLAPIKADEKKRKKTAEKKRKILKDLEEGTITPDEAKEKIRDLDGK